MTVRKRVTLELITTAAMQIVQSQGIEALTMRNLAAKLEIKAPSLYDHVKNRDAIIALVQAEGLRNFGAAFAAAGPSASAKVHFYRDWALTHANLYPVVFQQHLHRELLPEGLERQVLGQVVAVAGGSHIQARVLWAQLHGLVDLELQGRVPNDADMNETWNAVAQNIDASLKLARE